MKKVLAVVALLTLSLPVFADGMVEPEIESAVLHLPPMTVVSIPTPMPTLAAAVAQAAPAPMNLPADLLPHPAAPAPAEKPRYFRRIDWSHPHISAGACVDPSSPGESEGCSMLAIITHSHADGYWIIPGEDWAVGLGGSIHAGRAKLDIGPSFNLAPAAQKALLTALEKLTAEDKYQNIKSLLTPAPGKPSDLSIAFGPTFEFDPVARKGYLRIFTGPVWIF